LVKLVLLGAVLLVNVAWFRVALAVRGIADTWFGDYSPAVLIAAMRGMIILTANNYERAVLRWRQRSK